MRLIINTVSIITLVAMSILLNVTSAYDQEIVDVTNKRNIDGAMMPKLKNSQLQQYQNKGSVFMKKRKSSDDDEDDKKSKKKKTKSKGKNKKSKGKKKYDTNCKKRACPLVLKPCPKDCPMSCGYLDSPDPCCPLLGKPTCPDY